MRRRCRAGRADLGRRPASGRCSTRSMWTFARSSSASAWDWVRVPAATWASRRVFTAAATPSMTSWSDLPFASAMSASVLPASRSAFSWSALMPSTAATSAAQSARRSWRAPRASFSLAVERVVDLVRLVLVEGAVGDQPVEDALDRAGPLGRSTGPRRRGCRPGRPPTTRPGRRRSGRPPTSTPAAVTEATHCLIFILRPLLGRRVGSRANRRCTIQDRAQV